MSKKKKINQLCLLGLMLLGMMLSFGIVSPVQAWSDTDDVNECCIQDPGHPLGRGCWVINECDEVPVVGGCVPGQHTEIYFVPMVDEYRVTANMAQVEALQEHWAPTCEVADPPDSCANYYFAQVMLDVMDAYINGGTVWFDLDKDGVDDPYVTFDPHPFPDDGSSFLSPTDGQFADLLNWWKSTTDGGSCNHQVIATSCPDPDDPARPEVDDPDDDIPHDCYCGTEPPRLFSDGGIGINPDDPFDQDGLMFGLFMPLAFEGADNGDDDFGDDLANFLFGSHSDDQLRPSDINGWNDDMLFMRQSVDTDAFDRYNCDDGDGQCLLPTPCTREAFLCGTIDITSDSYADDCEDEDYDRLEYELPPPSDTDWPIGVVCVEQELPGWGEFNEDLSLFYFNDEYDSQSDVQEALDWMNNVAYGQGTFDEATMTWEPNNPVIFRRNDDGSIEDGVLCDEDDPPFQDPGTPGCSENPALCPPSAYARNDSCYLDRLPYQQDDGSWEICHVPQGCSNFVEDLFGPASREIRTVSSDYLDMGQDGDTIDVPVAVFEDQGIFCEDPSWGWDAIEAIRHWSDSSTERIARIADAWGVLATASMKATDITETALCDLDSINDILAMTDCGVTVAGQDIPCTVEGLTTLAGAGVGAAGVGGTALGGALSGTTVGVVAGAIPGAVAIGSGAVAVATVAGGTALIVGGSTILLKGAQSIGLFQDCAELQQTSDSIQATHDALDAAWEKINMMKRGDVGCLLPDGSFVDLGDQSNMFPLCAQQRQNPGGGCQWVYIDEDALDDMQDELGASMGDCDWGVVSGSNDAGQVSSAMCMTCPTEGTLDLNDDGTGWRYCNSSAGCTGLSFLEPGQTYDIPDDLSDSQLDQLAACTMAGFDLGEYDQVELGAGGEACFLKEGAFNNTITLPFPIEPFADWDDLEVVGCFNDASFTVRIASCVKSFTIYAVNYFSEAFGDFVMSFLMVLVLLAVILHGVKMMSMELQNPWGETMMFFIKLGAVIMFTINLGGFMQLPFDALGEMIAWVTSGIDDLSAGGGIFAGACSYPTGGLPEEGADYLVWWRLDCAFAHILGVELPGLWQSGTAASDLGLEDGILPIVAAGFFVAPIVAGIVIIFFLTGLELNPMSIVILITFFLISLLLLPFTGGFKFALFVIAFGGLSLIFTMLTTVMKALALYCMGIISIGITILISPLFIPMLLFRSTSWMFERWLRTLADPYIQLILFFAVFSIFLSIVSTTILDLRTFLGVLDGNTGTEQKFVDNPNIQFPETWTYNMVGSAEQQLLQMSYDMIAIALMFFVISAFIDQVSLLGRRFMSIYDIMYVGNATSIVSAIPGVGRIKRALNIRDKSR